MKYAIAISLIIGLSVFTFSCKKKKQSNSTNIEENQPPVQQDEKLKVIPYSVDAANAAAGHGDSFNIENAEIVGDSLIVDVSYGGGCQLHVFSLYSTGSYLKSLPLQMELTLNHQSNGDMCRAFLRNRIAFDIKQTKPNKGNELKIILNGNREKILTYKY